MAAVILYALVAAFDFAPLAKRVNAGERAVYLGLLGLSFALLILYALDVKFPTPTDLIRNALKGLLGA